MDLPRMFQASSLTPASPTHQQKNPLYIVTDQFYMVKKKQMIKTTFNYNLLFSISNN